MPKQSINPLWDYLKLYRSMIPLIIQRIEVSLPSNDHL